MKKEKNGQQFSTQHAQNRYSIQSACYDKKKCKLNSTTTIQNQKDEILK
jgi:hypothetical protein